MREADPHRAQLRERRLDLAGDEVEAARARPERDLPLDPHASETRWAGGEPVELRLGRRWRVAGARPTASGVVIPPRRRPAAPPRAGRPATCPARRRRRRAPAPPRTRAARRPKAWSRNRRAPPSPTTASASGPGPPSTSQRDLRGAVPARPHRDAVAAALRGHCRGGRRAADPIRPQRPVAAVGGAREARVEHDPAAARELGDHRHRAPGDQHVPVALRPRPALVGRRQPARMLVAAQ